VNRLQIESVDNFLHQDKLIDRKLEQFWLLRKRTVFKLVEHSIVS